MNHRIKTSKEGYAILKCSPLGDSALVVTEKCPFCGSMHTHLNPMKDERSSSRLRKSHCLDKSLSRIAEDGTSVGNHIYFLEIIDDAARKIN